MILAVLAVSKDLSVLVLDRLLPIDRKVQNVQRELIARRNTGVAAVLGVTAHALMSCARDLAVGTGARSRQLQRVNRVRVVSQLALLLAPGVFVLTPENKNRRRFIFRNVETVSERAAPPLVVLFLALSHYGVAKRTAHFVCSKLIGTKPFVQRPAKLR